MVIPIDGGAGFELTLQVEAWPGWPAHRLGGLRELSRTFAGVLGWVVRHLPERIRDELRLYWWGPSGRECAGPALRLSECWPGRHWHQIAGCSVDAFDLVWSPRCLADLLPRLPMWRVIVAHELRHAWAIAERRGPMPICWGEYRLAWLHADELEAVRFPEMMGWDVAAGALGVTTAEHRAKHRARHLQRCGPTGASFGLLAEFAAVIAEIMAPPRHSKHPAVVEAAKLGDQSIARWWARNPATVAGWRRELRRIGIE